MRRAALVGTLVFLGATDAAGQAAGGPPPPSINAPGGVAAGSITGGTFNVPGLSEADRAAAERRHAELLRGQEELLRSNQQLLATVARERGIPRATLQAVLARMGEAGVPEEAVEARLRAKADEYILLQAELARRPSDRPYAAAARAKAQALLDQGDLDGARAALAEGRGHLRARREQTAREEAGLAAEEARVARLSLRYQDAATLYEEAAGLLAFDAEAAWARTMDAADAFYDQGNEFGDDAALRDAIATYGKALVLTPRAARPLQWAMAQNNLGNALQALEEREAGTARLEQAVDAYRAALQEQTRERAPLDWATTQNNLGATLRVLGAREAGTARLEEAASAFDACLMVTTSVWPAEWVSRVRAHRDETQAEIKRRMTR